MLEAGRSCVRFSGHWTFLDLPDPYSHIMSLEFIELLTGMSTRILPKG
jgi:hypothetical protein